MSQLLFGWHSVARPHSEMRFVSLAHSTCIGSGAKTAPANGFYISRPLAKLDIGF